MILLCGNRVVGRMCCRRSVHRKGSPLVGGQFSYPGAIVVLACSFSNAASHSHTHTQPESNAVTMVTSHARGADQLAATVALDTASREPITTRTL